MMKKQFRILFAVTMGLVGGALLAQTESDFSGWMKEIAATNGKMKGAVASKDAATVTASAKVLETDFKAVETYLTKAGVADAAAMAAKNVTAAAAMQKAAAAGNFDEVATQSAVVGGSCAGCHMAHREKGPDGAYKMKK
jgi:cytochrome c556